jgi:nitrite reductase (NADH) large subunit
MTSIRLPLIDRNPLWTTAQWIGLVLTVVLLGALVRWPTPTLHILWDMVIPLLPAVFLVNPMLWRNVCPLATLNTVTGDRRQSGAFATPLLIGAWGLGIALLAVMVPARRFLFNEHGDVMAVTVAVVGILAVAMGAVVSRRGGFCNAICPVLPVEKLYGQAPLLPVGSARCHDCNHCTAAGCIDLAGGKSARQSVHLGEGVRWIMNPFGIFAAAFPGFVIGYFQTDNTAFAGAGATYLTVAAWAAGSLVLVILLVGLLRPKPTVVLPLLGGLAVALYYWFAAPALATAYGLPATGAVVLRALALVLIVTWLRAAFRRPPAEVAA